MATSESPQPDHYATLGLASDATSKDVEDAFHARVREHLQHANLSDKPIRERARQVGLAYETLRDPDKRRAFDESRTAATEAALPPIMAAPVEEIPAVASEALAPPAEPEPEPAPQSEFETAAKPPSDSSDTAVGPAADEPEPFPVADEPVSPEPVGERQVEPAAPDEPTAPPGNWHSAAVPVSATTFIDEPGADQAAVVPWHAHRRSGMHRGVLAAATLVIGVGIGGLLLTRVGSPSGQGRVHAVLPVAVSGGGSAAGTAGTAGTAEVPAQAGAPANDGTTERAPQSAPTTPTSPTESTTVAAATIPTEEDTAAALTPTPTATVEVKLPAAPPSTAAPAASAAATMAVAAAATPPAPPPPTPQARSVQPFPRWLGGGLMNSDNPNGQYQGTVGVRFTVEPNGQVGDCRAIASSGDPALDARTCGLVEQRLRFSPARNSEGTPMASEVRTTYTWGRTTRHR